MESDDLQALVARAAADPDAGPAVIAELARRAAAALARERAATEGAVRQARVLDELADRLSRVHSAEEVAREVTRFAQATLEAESVSIALADEAAGRFTLAGARGLTEAVSRRYATFPLDAPLAAAVAHRERRALVFDDLPALVAAAPELADAAAGWTRQAGAAVPLLVGDRSLGALALGYGRPRPIGAADRALILAIGREAAAALERGRLIAAAQREAERWRYLAHAGELLASTIDLRDTLATLARLAVPSLADWAAVDLFTAEGRVERLAVQHTDPEKIALAEELVRRYPPRLDDPLDGFGRLYHGGPPELVPEIPEEMLAAGAKDPWHLEAIRSLGLRSYLCVPLASGGRIRGAFSLVAAESGRRYGPDDLTLAVEIARRAALALDRSEVVAEVRRAEQAAQEARSRLELHLDISPAAVVELDRELRVTRFSREAERIFDRRPAEVTGRRLEEAGFLHEEDADLVRRALDEMVGGARRRSVLSVRSRRRDGALVWGEWYGSAVVDAEGRLVSVLCLVLDVTDRVLAQQALETADRRKDEFLAMLGHELRNPLGAIATARELLDTLGPQTPVVDKARATIGRQVDHMRRLLDDLLDVARISSGKLIVRREGLDLCQVVRDAVDDQRDAIEHAGLTLGLRLPPAPVPLRGDRTRLAQILANLLHNAVKFTPAGGRIDVELATQGGEAVLTVRDTGIGVEPGSLDELFEPFVQARPRHDRAQGGLGLGLALVKGLTVLHGGSVSARSDGPGRGTTFDVRLPVAAAADGVAALPTPAPGASLRVLIVDDDPDAGEMLQLLVAAFGHESSLAADGPSALQLAREVRPQLVLCDIGLPGTMDGYDVARALRADPEVSGTFLVALTGFGLPEHVRRAELAGFDRHVTKPLPAPLLRELLAEARQRGA